MRAEELEILVRLHPFIIMHNLFHAPIKSVHKVVLFGYWHMNDNIPFPCTFIAIASMSLEFEIVAKAQLRYYRRPFWGANNR